MASPSAAAGSASPAAATSAAAAGSAATAAAAKGARRGKGSFRLGGAPSATRYCHIAIPAQNSATALQRFTRLAGASPIFDSMSIAASAEGLDGDGVHAGDGHRRECHVHQPGHQTRQRTLEKGGSERRERAELAPGGALVIARRGGRRKP